MIAKVVALIFPVLLFIFKYILPSLAEGVYTDKKIEKEQAKIAAIHFPVDLLFVAVGYTIPKIIEATSRLATMEVITGELMNEYKDLVTHIGIYGVESFLILLLVPFMVFVTKFAENNYYRRKKRGIVQTFICYAIAFGMIWVSLFKV